MQGTAGGHRGDARTDLLRKLRQLCDHIERFPGDQDWAPHEAHMAVRAYFMRTGDMELVGVLAFLGGLICQRCEYAPLDLDAARGA